MSGSSFDSQTEVSRHVSPVFLPHRSGCPSLTLLIRQFQQQKLPKPERRQDYTAEYLSVALDQL